MTTLLLVEDNEMNRDMLARRLERKGFDVITAVNGEEAIAAAKSEKPELILMDMEIPIIDGWTATRQIKRTISANIPIIALTAHAMSTDREKALAAGCDDYATKPIDFAQLLIIIEQQLTGNTG
jgi:two-component system cell cycle response regulator DivK